MNRYKYYNCAEDTNYHTNNKYNTDTNTDNSSTCTSTNNDDDKDDTEYDDDDEYDNNDNDNNSSYNKRNYRPEVLCSVLNTVVDYVMVSPDPIFDSIEYNDNNNNINKNKNKNNQETTTNVDTSKISYSNNKAQVQVPLIRIFGPIVRRQKQQQQQQQNSIYTPDSTSTGSAAAVPNNNSNNDDDDDSSENDNNNNNNNNNTINRSPPSLSSTSSLSSAYPIQNSCLYIHGVYPYIIARPVQCGPDGSMLLLSSMKVNYNYTTGSSTTTNSSATNSMPLHQKEYVNWDNVQSVQSIIPQLTIALEACIQQSIDESTTFNDTKNNNNNKNNTNTTNLRKHIVKVIHNVSIVSGRGFYTYCPGSIVPFIKIQYYNPKDRWRIKRCLETGISIQHFDQYYYPHRIRYNSKQFIKNNSKVITHNSHNNNNTKSSKVDSPMKCNENNNNNNSDSSTGNESDSDNDDNDNDNDNFTTKHNNRRNRTNNNNNNNNNNNPNDDYDDKDLLIFNCYEAHIPYTMQFFKDNNLAGMSYIHISSEAIVQQVPVPTTTTTTATTPDIDNHNNNEFTQCLDGHPVKCDTTTATTDTFVQFRYPLPINIPRRTALLQQQHVANRSTTASHNNNNNNNNLDACFLQSNTPNTYYNTSLLSTSNHNNDNKYVEHTKRMMKQTSCDIELDIMVQHIVNVYDVMTELPTNINTQQRQQIHWRAVPSLREIWMEERCRMTKLLPPQHNFLSQSSSSSSLIQQSTSTPRIDKEEEEDKQFKQQQQKTPPFTLAVKTSQSDEPGAELAVRGMKRLVNVTIGLQNEFRRSLQQIIQRHIQSIQFISTNIQHFQQQQQQQRLQQKEENKQRRRKLLHESMLPVKRRHRASFDGVQTTPVIGRSTKKHKFDTQTNSIDQQQKALLSLDEMLTPTHDEALEALYGMNVAFNHDTLNMSQHQSQDENLLSNTALTFPSTQPSHYTVNDDILVNNQQCTESFVYKDESDADDNNSVVQQQSQEWIIFSQQANAKHRKNYSRNRFQQLSQAYYPSSIRDNSQIPLKSQNMFMLTQEISQRRHRRQQQSLKQLSPQEEFELSQRLERGDGIVQGGAFEHIDDVIDSQTLIPYDDTDVDNDEEDDDDELCSVNNNEVIDGYNSDETDTGNHNDQTLSVKKFEQQLSMLATQADLAIGDVSIQLSQDNVVPEHDRLLKRVVTTTSKKGYVQNDQDEQDDDSDSSYALLSGSRSSQDVVALSSQHFSTSPATSKTRIEDTSNENRNVEIPWQQFPNVDTRLLEHPPSRTNFEIDKSFRSHSIVPAGSHISRSHHVDSNQHHDVGWFPSFPNVGGVEVCLIESPPDRGTVQLWHTQNSQSVNGVTAPKRNPQNIDNASSPTRQSKAVLNPIENGSTDDKNQLFIRNAQQSTASDSETVIKMSAETQPDRLLSESIGDKTQLSLNDQPLQGIGNQGGRLWVEGGGQLKAKTRQSPSNADQYRGGATDDDTNLPTPVTIMQIEVHIQCRTGRSGVNDSKIIAMTPDSDRDKIYAIVCVFARDPGGGEVLQCIENICLFVPVERELQNLTHGMSNHCERLANAVKCSMPKQILGTRTHLTVECLSTEHQLLLRFASIVRQRDPDMLVSWDTQGAGLGYIIERGVAIGKNIAGTSDVSLKEIDMARLLGRTPTARNDSDAASIAEDAASAALEEMIERRESVEAIKGEGKKVDRWKGSGLGSEWDERVGAGAAAASICGRLVFAAWKLIAEEIKHANFSYLPAVVSSVLDKRIPFHDNLRLTQWFSNDSAKERWRVIHHRVKEAVACLQLFDVLDIIGRSGEAARLSGVEFSQSFPGIRGSQYKVEGVLLRALQSLNSNERGSRKGRQRKTLTMTNMSTQGLTMDRKSQIDSPWKATRLANDDDDDAAVHSLTGRGYFFFSPSFRDVNYQEALEVQALTLEPVSGHRLDPVVVCDFTALYPSLIIAYNLCYSTCAGRLEYHSTRGDMMQEGRTTGRIGPFSYSELRSATVAQQHMKSLTENSNPNHDRAYVAPSGTIFVSERVLKGVLPQVLDEMLSTRAMLKKASKFYKKHVSNLNPAILRQLEARQLALKYVANVTYGYTSATFSGRCAMPLLADTIVECARRTLTNAINLANKWGADPSGRWNGAKVIYGDTDSVFVELPGRTVQEAFDFGEEFCGAVTANNPPPVQLKLEKVYLGSMMQTKKKYCGMKFESRDQKRPDFEAKGIETIRRDQCALTQKVLKQALTTLYKTGIESVKSYLTRQWLLILGGHCPVSDFILTGRVRSRYRGGRIGPVQAVLAKRLAEADPGRVVRHKERQPYVIVASPGLKFTLKDNVLTPIELLEQWDTYSIHTTYYITRHLNAALQRCLSLDPYQMDVHAWFEQCPKPRGRIHFWPVTKLKASSTLMISSFFGSDRCSLCGQKAMADGRSRAAICQECRSDPVQAGETVIRLLNQTQQDSIALAIRCSKCNLCYEDSSTFAPVMQSHTQTSRKASTTFGISTTRKSVTTSIAIPIANCTCIDCPTLFDRHSLREKEMEAAAVCNALNLV